MRGDTEQDRDRPPGVNITNARIRHPKKRILIYTEINIFINRDEARENEKLNYEKIEGNMGFNFYSIIGFGKCNPKVDVIERNR